MGNYAPDYISVEMIAGLLNMMQHGSTTGYLFDAFHSS